MSNFEDVKTFMKVFKQEVKERPEFPDNEVIGLRVALIQEELDELCVAVDENDIVGIADALADILYVTYGAAASFGIDLDACFAEVHRSNMSKLNAEGKPVYRVDGKILKSNLYTPPDLKKVLFGDIG